MDIGMDHVGVTSLDRAALRQRLNDLPVYLSGQIFGQNRAVEEVSKALQIGERKLVPTDRPAPKSMMLFLGPTGVGKTEICERASQFLYGTASIAKINCSELGDAADTKRLIGSASDPEGILGMEIDALARKQGRIILFDEIEKAHPNVSKLLLQMEAAQIMLFSKRKIDLTPYHVVCTSNLGTKMAARMGEQGFPKKYIEDTVLAAAANFFAQEVLERFTRRIVFHSLTREIVLQIAHKFIDSELRALRRHEDFVGVTDIRVCEGVFEALATEGFNLVGGARPMARTVANRIREAANDWLSEHDFAEGAMDLMLSPKGGLCLRQREVLIERSTS